MMKIEYDQEADAAYIYLKHPIKPGEVRKTSELKEDVFLDYDEKGKILGLEILNAKKKLTKNVLVEAKQSQ